jgi:hypothetical protein
MNKQIYGYGVRVVTATPSEIYKTLDSGDEMTMMEEVKLYQRVILGVTVSIPPAYAGSRSDQLREARAQAHAALTNSDGYDWLSKNNWGGHVPKFHYTEDLQNDKIIGSMEFMIDEKDYLVYLMGR